MSVVKSRRHPGSVVRTNSSAPTFPLSSCLGASLSYSLDTAARLTHWRRARDMCSTQTWSMRTPPARVKASQQLRVLSAHEPRPDLLTFEEKTRGSEPESDQLMRVYKSIIEPVRVGSEGRGGAGGQVSSNLAPRRVRPKRFRCEGRAEGGGGERRRVEESVEDLLVALNE